MNRVKKEERKKYNDKVQNMSIEEKQTYDFLVKIQSRYNDLLRELHGKLFAEEYDFICDSSVDVKERRLGKNPMNEVYIKEVNAKRVNLGFLPLDASGEAQDSEATLDYCQKLIINKEEMI